MIQITKKVIPIICPEYFYYDRFGHPNAYKQCNCSLYYNQETKDITVLVRLINYTKFSNASFVVGGSFSDSIYYLLTGKSFDDLQAILVKYDWNDFPFVNTHWRGLEDIRFVNQHTLMVTCCERNDDGKPCLFLASLENNVIKLQMRMNPHVLEKNWMPFEDKVIYQVSPFIVKSLVIDDRQTLPIGENLEKLLRDYHGSTNGIPYELGYLFLIHKNEKKSIHRWLFYDPKDHKVTVSDPFVFFQYSFYEYPYCMSRKDKDHVFVSMGVNESLNYILEISIHDIHLNY